MSLGKNVGAVFLGLVLAIPSAFGHTRARESTEVIFDGEPTLVFFSDGDTFRILVNQEEKKNRIKSSSVRIVGFNCLENYGPVHEFGGQSTKELYENSKAATDAARKGGWNCESTGAVDVYGRLLATCDDLGVALIRKGLAHVYSTDEKPGLKKFITAQRYAQRNKLGMWKSGIPEYIITSLHSAEEGAKKTYNRMISSADGSSKSWLHRDSYETCTKVCREGSCMVYVPYVSRYGTNRPECLRKSQ